jgi:hypothetical protein
MHFSAGAGTHVPNQVGLPGAPSTQVLTIENFDPLKSIMNPCTISPLHLGHRMAFALMLKPLERELEEVAIYVEYIILLPKSALRQIYNKLHQLFSEEKLDTCASLLLNLLKHLQI